MSFLLFACCVLKILHDNLLKKTRVLVKRKLNIDINAYYVTFKTGSYFQLKCSASFSLMSNVVYKFNCLRDAYLSYIAMTTHHSNVKVREHLHSKVILTVGKHIITCHVCKEKLVDVNNSFRKLCL